MDSRIFTDPALPAGFEARQKYEALTNPEDPRNPFKIIPQKNPATGQVYFLVEGDNIDKALEEIYCNEPVGVLDFIKALKGLRSSIFALKGAR